jgi:hypothetical protein
MIKTENLTKRNLAHSQLDRLINKVKKFKKAKMPIKIRQQEYKKQHLREF